MCIDYNDKTLLGKYYEYLYVYIDNTGKYYQNEGLDVEATRCATDRGTIELCCRHFPYRALPSYSFESYHMRLCAEASTERRSTGAQTAWQCPRDFSPLVRLSGTLR